VTADDIAPGSGPELRVVAAGDAPHLAPLHAACFEDPWPAPAIRDVLAMPGAFGYAVVCSAAAPAGFALGRVNTDEAELLTLAVDPTWRRHGLARSLVETIGAHAAAHGATRLFLEVAEDNAAARALYAAGGFVTVGRRRGYYARRLGPAVDALTMRRDLPPGGASWLAKP
jgi:ribosomal-protein-alanine N-acetyltransferase